MAYTFLLTVYLIKSEFLCCKADTNALEVEQNHRYLRVAPGQDGGH